MSKDYLDIENIATIRGATTSSGNTFEEIENSVIELIDEKSIFALICGSLSIWLFTGVITDLISKIREAKVKLQNIKQLFFFISKINLGIYVAHIGVAIFLAGVTGEQFYKSEYNVRKKVGDIINVGTKSLKFDKILSTVSEKAFSGGSCPNPGDPLLLHFRIKSNNQPICNTMADQIKNILQPTGRLLGRDYSYENYGCLLYTSDAADE